MNFIFRNGLIWVAIGLEYEGIEIKVDNCILDTGSATTAIDIEIVDFNYKKSSIIKRLVGIGGGTQEVISQRVSKILFDNVQIEDIEIEFGDIQADLGINGFIGNDILSRFDIDIKFSKQKIYFDFQ